MSVTKRFAPKTFKDLVGNPKAHEQLKTFMTVDKTPVCLVGDPGVGKTAAVYAIANELGMTVMELNASDQRTKKSALPDMVRFCQQTPMFDEKLVFLLDEVDGMGSVDGKGAWEFVKDILVKSKHPVVLTCNNDYKIPTSVKKLLVTVRLARPNIGTVQKFAEKVLRNDPFKTPPTADKLTNDFRNAINVSLFDGESYRELNTFAQVSRFFVEGITDRIEDIPMAFLFDNAPYYLKGWDLFQFYRILEISTRSDVGILSLCPRGMGQYARFPGYYRMGSGRKKEDEDNGTINGSTDRTESPT